MYKLKEKISTNCYVKSCLVQEEMGGGGREGREGERGGGEGGGGREGREGGKVGGKREEGNENSLYICHCHV